MMTRERRLVAIVFFLSGACALIDEVVWARLLKLTLGNTVHASAIVVSTFMAGLALGALVARRWTDRVARPLRAYAVLETVVALAALAFPVALGWADALYRCAFPLLQDRPAALLAVQAVVSATLLLVPTALMGAGLPLLAPYVTRRAEQAGRLVGRLYAINTLGAAAGCLLAGLVLIRAWGVLGAILTAAALNLLVAAAAWRLSRHEPRTKPACPPSGVKSRLSLRESSATFAERKEFREPVLLLGACFLSGFAVLGYEVLWVRSFVLRLGGFTYVFSAVLGVYLVGHTLGSLLGSRLTAGKEGLAPWVRSSLGAVAANGDCPPLSARFLGISLIALGACGVGFVPFCSYWFALAPAATGNPLAQDAATALGKILLPLWHAAVVLLLPSLLSGMTFPLALQAWGRFRTKVGENTGLVYGVNTLGAVCGGLATGFLLLPGLGTQAAASLLGLGLAWWGALVVSGRREDLRRVRGWAAPAAAAALSILACAMPADLFRTTFAHRFGGEIVEIREGTSALVAVVRMPDKSRIMAIDNVPMVGDGVHRSAQQTLGHLPVLLHAGPRSALSIGFGGGETTACLARHGLERIDCVEVAPEVVELALGHFSHINLGPELGRRVRMISMDAKNYLKCTDRKYDVIINDSDVHSTAASAPLFSRDHFQEALAHLAPGGRFMTKLHLQGDPRSNVECILRTFTSVFPHTTVWFPVTKPFLFVYLVGSADPQRHSPEELDRRLAAPTVRESIRHLNVRTAVDLLGFYLGDEEDLRRWLPPGPVHSDWAPVLEFNADPHALALREFLPELAEHLHGEGLLARLDFPATPADGRRRWLKEFAAFQEAARYLLRAHTAPDAAAALWNAESACRLQPGHPAAENLRTACFLQIRSGLELRSLAPDRLAREAADARGQDPACGAAWLVEGLLDDRRGEKDAAAAALEKAVELDPMWADARDMLGAFYHRQGRTKQALFQFRAAAGLRAALAEQ
ncbi:MAG: fused MFS/spermidine synthase [Thermoguttaceae bacterium]|jgi:predicted membrane-bound spermidine synthase